MAWFSFLTMRTASSPRSPRVFFTNTLSGAKEVFIPLKPGQVLMYTCGPTAYGPVHVGNLRAAWLPDQIARTLQSAGYRVRRVINITDFGHLVTDGDAGEDKMTKGLVREGLTPTLKNTRTMAEKYTTTFIEDLAEINVDTEQIIFPRASDYIPEQIALIKTLEQKRYAYATPYGVYFDTSRFPSYGRLGDIQVDAQQEGVRMVEQREKRNPADFVLWKPDVKLGWESPWGLGFPGWHIECSAMIRSLLGDQIDIHTGGEDLASVHHNNEIAQSETASGRLFSRYWMHNAFLTMSGEKASKSLGNVVYLSDITEKGFHPLALRYFFLQAHYRTPLSFSWEALRAASNALERLWRLATEVREESRARSAPSEIREYFLARMRDDLATPQALGGLWDALRSEEYTPEEKWGLIEDAEAHLGLSLLSPPRGRLTNEETPAEVRELVARREAARAQQDFEEADRLRERLADSGYRVDDGHQGPVLTKTR